MFQCKKNACCKERDRCSSWKYPPRSGARNRQVHRDVSAPVASRRLDDLDSRRGHGVGGGHRPHACGLPPLRDGRVGRDGRPETMRPASEHESRAEGMGTSATPSAPVSRHGHGLRASLAFDQLPACPSLRVEQRRADHDRGERRGVTSRMRGRTVRTSPLGSATTAARIPARPVRESNVGPMEGGRAATLARIGRRSGAEPRRPQPRRNGMFRSRSGRPQACRPPGCH